MSLIVTCNAGSTNTKLAVFDAGTLECKDEQVCYSLKETTEWLAGMAAEPLAAIAHRVVHGGTEFTTASRLDTATLSTLRSLIPLAPLHQPSALELVALAMQLFPHLPHIACFDTAFHHTLPALEQRLPLPQDLHDAGIRRYGFHGLSYEYIATILPKLLEEMGGARVIAAHLGGGSSACALRHGQSIATTMGFSTLDGLMMSTRSGALDAGVLLHLLKEKHWSTEAVSDLLYHRSGLLGVSGESADMRSLLASNAPHAQEAVDLYCYLAAKQMAGLLPALGGVDVIVFAGGIGEHAAIIRERICHHLRWLGVVLDPESNEQHQIIISTPESAITACVIATNEALCMAKQTKVLVGA